MAEFETKNVKLDLRSKRGNKKLAELVADGWEVVTPPMRKGWWQWGDKQHDQIVLRRAKG